MLVPGKRLAVFSIKKPKDKEGRPIGQTVWVRAGSAWVNKDNSMNIYLDVLPLDGTLHVREAAEKRDPARDPATTVPVTPIASNNELHASPSSSMPLHSAPSLEAYQ